MKYINLKNFKNYKKVVILIIIVFTLFTALQSNFVYGQINTSYGQSDSSGNIDTDLQMSNSTVLKLLAKFIYGLAAFIEYVFSYLVKYVTGSQMYPWADKIIFNSISFLDINFINPSEGSLFLDLSGKSTVIGTIVKRIYYIIFTLSMGFLGIIVGIMAVKLATSAIASEKAKYKQAIKNWLIALILIFITHNLISFIFFINEKLVEVASSVFISATESYIGTPLVSINEKKWENENPNDAVIGDQLPSMSKTIMEEVIKETNNLIKSGNGEKVKNDEYMYEVVKNMGYSLNDEGINQAIDYVQNAYAEVYNEALNNGTGTGIENFFTNMSTFFKQNITINNKFNSIMAVLYAIFVLESFMYFITYIKRIFYVIILAMIAPLIVVYDFYKKIFV